MDLEQLQDLQQELLGIIFLIVAPYNAEEEIDMKDRALKIIDELKDHINDDIEMNNLRVTILDCIVLCDSQGNVRLNNRSLLDLEDAVKSIGGKTSQEERENRKLKKEIRGKLCLVAFAIFGEIVSRNLRESEVGTIVDAALIGSLFIQCYMFLASLISREAEQRVVDSTSESTAGLSTALAVGTLALTGRIVKSIVGTNMEFGESLRSVLMTTTAAGAGAALSTAWIKRTFSTNLENVATEQQNIQGQRRTDKTCQTKKKLPS